MKLDHNTCYKIIKSKDARFDGVFYTAVKTTGIYCRPVCKVPAPKSENCTFYGSAEEAESRGYRPCLRCRPELAPGYSEFEQGKLLLRLAMAYFEEHNFAPGLIGACAEALGVSARHISRVFKTQIGTSPQNYMMTRRLLKAKLLLTDTTLPIGEIALNCGFGSQSRFNAAVRKHYKLTPNGIRKTARKTSVSAKKNEDTACIELNLAYRPPYDWQGMMDFLRVRAIPHVEIVTGAGVYRRSVKIEDANQTYTGWLELIPKPSENCAVLRVSPSLERVIFEVVTKIRRVFDLDFDPMALPEGIRRSTRLPGCFDAFEMSCRAILGQQITVKAATTLTGRLADKFGLASATPWPEVRRHFPRPKEIEVLEPSIFDNLGELGIIRSRTQTLLTLSKRIDDGSLSLSRFQDIEGFKSAVMEIKGIGRWTAEYLSMRALSWPDAFPVTDLGVKQALFDLLKDETGNLISSDSVSSKYVLNKKYEKAACVYASAFEPYRSYLTIDLWKRLSKPLEEKS